MLKIRRILISVWDKKGIVEFARKLADFGIEMISTGKTASLLRKGKIEVREISSFTSCPEILGGRVKTLHPKIFGGILANKKHPLHIEEMKNLEIQPIDMVVVNLYPFAEKLKSNLGQDEMMEYIDIGGCALLRAGAKNFKNVACVSSFSQYKLVLEELEKNKGFLSHETLRSLAADAFYLTKEYDNCIYGYFKGKELLTLDLEKISSLRYGENPHQKASLYKSVNLKDCKLNQIQGKELSFNNFLDLDTACTCVSEFDEPAAVIVKHASICGVGVDKKLRGAYKKAYSVDPLSAFGGTIGLNRKVDGETARQILKSEFKECVIGPSYSKEALRIFSSKKNLRVLEVDPAILELFPDIRVSIFGCLVGDKDTLTLNKGKLDVVSKKKPSPRELKDLILAWKVVKSVRSNAIVAVKNQCILGIGGGQPSRVGAVEIVLKKANKSLKGAVLASDGFFPQVDSLKLASRCGIKAIIQPGGSIKDKEVINFCNKTGIAMLFTGVRHFRH
ncbi:MAG: bifunctional phosphoribosylaminoimidazolecarboxamide formyltransferase/IMP cyclohydrolase [Candidatus Omnitrophica bacterium]|nr:bifunctional phosphoribosylaminoimidazolecarboxamide formyltransferase/IMP cyclohydrolase [Candidatus Omnitrophota bacterium]MBU0896105.1 bifunctional phosphoribosylaminoimidazolecarboxamide formyltransferase/IMP cyclohydrolase [Candidatus Omnitrophota bacterium]MBU1134393.1 bifunctional phosphoribosylaminoimidazolecarboxamide formyltransferase/IMP cyclohydrolase [Candidatus Omnitrophota bacterium]MBU1810012.1 bifunctional phosphoribosylaminoimidazolecarboxamide formyltransferase/IMP cyclohyd